VLGIGLVPEWRGRGVGRRLMEHALEAARAFPLARVELWVRADNARAIALYRQIGFEEEGRRRRTLLVDGVYYDDIMMALLFDMAP
jgi:ribosomal protein S18 acetylase RimI-like enzyme